MNQNKGKMSFEEECAKVFEFLVKEYGFKVRRSGNKRNKYYCEFRAEYIGITIAYEPPDSNLNVMLHWREHGKIEEIPIFITPEAKLRSFYLMDLLLLRGATKEEMSALTEGPSRNPRDSRTVLENSAVMLRKYAKDILSGSTEVFYLLEKQVKIRVAKTESST